MHLSKSAFICFFLLCLQAPVSRSTEPQEKSTDFLNGLFRLFSARSESRSTNDDHADNFLKPKDLDEESTEEQPISPVTVYLLKRLMFGAYKPEVASKRRITSRNLRADRVIGISSRENIFPWDEECSGGYNHCGGYFPLCCEGFLCLKPLTPWDKANGIKRCWPHYFKEDENEDGR